MAEPFRQPVLEGDTGGIELLESLEDEVGSLRGPAAGRMDHERLCSSRRGDRRVVREVDDLGNIDRVGDEIEVQDAGDDQTVRVGPDHGESPRDQLLVGGDIGEPVETPRVFLEVPAAQAHVGSVERKQHLLPERANHREIPEPGEAAFRPDQAAREMEVEYVEVFAERLYERIDDATGIVPHVDGSIGGEGIRIAVVFPDFGVVPERSQPLRRGPRLIGDVARRVQDAHRAHPIAAFERVCPPPRCR